MPFSRSALFLDPTLFGVTGLIDDSTDIRHGHESSAAGLIESSRNIRHIPMMKNLKARVANTLQAIQQGDLRAAESLVPIVYAQLRQLSAAFSSRLRPGQTLQATALVNEAYLKLVGTGDPGWQSRAHFFGAAARAMRDIMVDDARRKAARKHGAGWQRVTLHDQAVAGISSPQEFLDLHTALERLEAEYPRQSEVVMLRMFAGLSIEETAEALDIGTASVERDWRFARAWLLSELQETPTRTGDISA
jgi:RNA polymerase sigma factor (TIGR02999 family)